MPLIQEPIRERILKQVVREFQAIRDGVDGYVVTWNKVDRDAPKDVEQLVGDNLFVTTGSELNTDEVRTVRKSMELFTEFWVRTEVGGSKSETANLVLADVQRTVREALPLVEDGTDCQLAIDVVETRNETDTESDDLVGGVVVWEVRYRHTQGDPRSIGPGH